MIIKFINKKTGLNIIVDFENKLYISMKYNDLCNSTLNNYDVVYVQANEDIKIIQGICKQENYAEVE